MCYSLTEATLLQAELCKLECHFTWELKKEDLDLTDLLNRLEQHVDMKLGGGGKLDLRRHTTVWDL